jgi:hypothetical protein
MVRDLSRVHILGIKNVADMLSRLIPLDEINKPSNLQEQSEDYVRFVAVNATLRAVTTREVERASAEDDELSDVGRCLDTGQWDNCGQKVHCTICSELCVIGKLVLCGTRIIIPQKLRPRLLALAHEGHLGVVGTKQILRTKVWWPNLEKDAEKLCKSCHGCQITSRPNLPEPIRIRLER